MSFLNIFTATHKINSSFRSDDKKSAGQSNSVGMFPTLSVPSGSDIVPSGPAVVHRSTQPWRDRTVHTLEQGSQRGLNIIQSNKPSPIGHLNNLIQRIIFKNKSAIKHAATQRGSVQGNRDLVGALCLSVQVWGLFLWHVRQSGLCIYYYILLCATYITDRWRWESQNWRICSVQSSYTLLWDQGRCKFKVRLDWGVKRAAALLNQQSHSSCQPKSSTAIHLDSSLT